MKKFLPDLIAILAFIVISFIYFFPAITEDRILFQHDTVAGAGAGQEAKEYYERTGERTRWTNALFGGMPTYQMSPSYDSTEPLTFVQKVYHLFLPNYVWLTFIMMLGFYILLRAFGIPAWLAGLGGIIWGFSSYFFILIAAGHIWKFITLAYIPPTIAGIVLAYRKKYLLGGIITALFMAMQILSNHVQMTYYFLFVILFMVGAFFEDAWRKKELPQFFKATGVLIVAGLIGVSINLSNLYHTYEYSKETMRGKSELKYEGATAKQTSSGLNRDYITQWSYGIGETFSLLVPNVKGGASVPLSRSEKAMEKANPMYSSLYSQLTQYFGDQPMTSGPVYVGAFVLMLFILGCFIVKGPMKWALLGATIFSILLSWGKNFMGLTDFFIDYIPMYNKFRAVSSILVIAEFTIPLLAILTLKEILTKPELLKEKLKYIYISFGLTGGLALLFAIAPRLFFPTYIPGNEMAALQNALPADQLSPIIANLEEMRVHLFTSDAWRSFFIVTIGTLLLLAYNAKKLKATWTVAAIALLCLGDMWSVNKRYLYDEQFIPKSEQTATFRKTQTDELILQDPSLDYRVLNFAGNTFEENNTSYWHKSVGGYHAAKLRRYQEMIDHHIAKEMQAAYQEVATAGGQMDSVNAAKFPVLNMLNTKYFIFPAGQQGQTVPIENPYTFGNAWFIDKIQYVNNANEEIDAIGQVDLQQTAIVDSKFKEALKGVNEGYKDSLSTIRLTSYEPNQLVYETSSPQDGIVVFSEIYYPGWTATIDGKPADIARADYILRAMNVPAGKHTIEMRFDPQSLHITEGIAYGAMALLLVGVIILIWIYRKKYSENSK
ncbi:bacterial membrane YfhO family protein [Bacteroides fragilis str. S38L5]|uniref:YfhO family protein n=1 Tax=Bacteroides fragilis TaxID=817 RepID=UPI00044F6E6E|nr:YfhO family protein [Bacteroides fragilis]EYA93730.1 bacterial membrane YfhO family protein [Bacteroides fragilis str. S38L5]EYB12297.1 bacterial membrane YfhO family protein [Bacteroides fragilis str. S38L3]MCE9298194.1 YfhO family protein [Bacteroides fragilis]MCE9314091.1 YfhO family protein [Bacteroides fragilis]MCZ2693871.1 YfhO family protein [Bacteroides fragilis]